MKEPASKKVKQLLENTHAFLSSYQDKAQWTLLYPVISKLAEQYRVLYTENAPSLQAQLTLFNTNYDYAHNLIVNQCVLTAAMCASQQYNKELTELYISVALVDHFCVCAQLNKLADHINFTERDKKIWQLRHQFTAKIMLSSGRSTELITSLLAKLGKYKHALVSTPKIMLYDNSVTLVALANIIAMNTTYTASKKHINLYKALGDLYIRTPNQFAQQLIKSLIAHIGPLLPGSRVLYNEQPMVYLATDLQQHHVIIDTKNKKKLAWYRVKASLNDSAKQWYCTNSTLHFSVWDSEHIVKKIQPTLDEPQMLIGLISNIKLQHEYSYKGLNQIIATQHHIVAKVCQAVQSYNKEHLVAKDLKHSLSMVGYANAPAIIQRVIFEQLVSVTPHPLQQFVLQRLTCLIQIMALLVGPNKRYQYEHITLPLYAYVYFLLTQCSTKISRRISFDETANKTLTNPFSNFFGVCSFDKKQLNDQLNILLSDNPWTKTLTETEQLPKKQLNAHHKLWVALYALAQKVFKPELSLTPWQQQVLNEQLVTQGWKDKRLFYQQFQSLNLSNTI